MMYGICTWYLGGEKWIQLKYDPLHHNRIGKMVFATTRRELVPVDERGMWNVWVVQ